MRKWWEFIEETRNNPRKRSSGQGIERSLKWFLDTGNQKKGGYPKQREPNFSKKKFNDISAPPDAPGGLEEEVDPDSFRAQTTLEPSIWLNEEELQPDIRDRLIQISFDFMESLEVNAVLVDIRLTGSLANYNWSEYSDLDLHLVVDFASLNDDEALVKKFFDASRMRWNDRHDIKIYGYEVEIYVENIDEEHRSSGVFSVLKDEWLEEPDPDGVRDAWTTLARKKSDDILTQINLIQSFLPSRPKAALRSVDRLKRKISLMRRVGLESKEQEYSTENVIFKILRREGALDLLSQLKDQAYDAAFSVG